MRVDNNYNKITAKSHCAAAYRVGGVLVTMSTRQYGLYILVFNTIICSAEV